MLRVSELMQSINILLLLGHVRDSSQSFEFAEIETGISRPVLFDFFQKEANWQVAECQKSCREQRDSWETQNVGEPTGGIET